MSARRPVRKVRPFSPSQESPAVLSDRTVGRERDLEILVARLISAAQSGNRAHSLLIGPRGAGKTHLLNVAMHRARQHPDVERRVVFVRFDEDAVGSAGHQRFRPQVFDGGLHSANAFAVGKKFHGNGI